MSLGTVLVLMSIILLAVAEYFRRRGRAADGAMGVSCDRHHSGHRACRARAQGEIAHPLRRASGLKPMIECRDVQILCRLPHALRIDLTIREGEFFSLLGPRDVARPHFYAPSPGSRIFPRAWC